MQDFLTFAKVSIVFVAVVVAMKRKVPMGLALSGGGFAIALLMGRSPAWIGRELTGLDGILFSEHTCQFVAAMGLIVALSHVLERAGQIERLTAAFRKCFSNPRVTLAALPAIIGFLPMPAGALFSAPMVEASATGTGLDKEDKALVNYWYRHVWEYAWPLYPGVLFSAQLMRMEVRTLSLAQAPLCLAAILAGFIFLARAGRPPAEREEGRRLRAGAEAFVILIPFLLIFGLYLVARLPLIPSVALGLGVACLWHGRRLGAGGLARTLFANWGVLDMMLMGYGAKIFGDLMMRSQAIEGISAMLQSLNLPVAAAAVVLPATVGFFAGMTIVYVMTTLPVLLALPGVAAHPLPVMTLAFAAGYCGTLLSPVHSCLVVSAGYWKSDLGTVIRRMLIPCGIVLGTGVALMAAYRHLRP